MKHPKRQAAEPSKAFQLDIRLRKKLRAFYYLEHDMCSAPLQNKGSIITGTHSVQIALLKQFNCFQNQIYII